MKIEDLPTWRTCLDGKAHAIGGCDERASGWIALCGYFVTGEISKTGDTCCEKCAELNKDGSEARHWKAVARYNQATSPPSDVRLRHLLAEVVRCVPMIAPEWKTTLLYEQCAAASQND